MILADFDPNKKAVINPENLVNKQEGIPDTAVTCFSRDTFHRLVKELDAVKITVRSLANLEIPIYIAEYKGYSFVLYLSSVGAPACGLLMEDVYALGVNKIVMFGTCGVLDSSIDDCSIIIPDKAVRDEGTSYHYAPLSDEVDVNKNYVNEFIELLNQYECKYTVGKVWTTDAFYRETYDKVAKRKAQGCICVDMECSAAAAIAQFREKELFQFFYAADNLDNENWDMRSLSNTDKLDEKDKIAILAMEMAYKITAKDK